MKENLRNVYRQTVPIGNTPKTDAPKVDKRHKTDAEKWSELGKWVRVKSSNVHSIMYDRDNKELWVQFLAHSGRSGGAKYKYKNVPEKVAQELFRAPSIGKYLNASIKNVYSFDGPLA